MVANSPRIGVGLGFDSQGCVTFLSQILLSQLVLHPLCLDLVKRFGQHSNTIVIKIYQLKCSVTENPNLDSVEQSSNCNKTFRFITDVFHL